MKEVSVCISKIKTSLISTSIYFTLVDSQLIIASSNHIAFTPEDQFSHEVLAK